MRDLTALSDFKNIASDVLRNVAGIIIFIFISFADVTNTIVSFADVANTADGLP